MWGHSERELRATRTVYLAAAEFTAGAVKHWCVQRGSSIHMSMGAMDCCCMFCSVWSELEPIWLWNIRCSLP